MRDDLSLLIIVWVLYLLELTIWLPKSAVLFNLVVRRNPTFADGFPGNSIGSLYLNHIIPWFHFVSIGRQPLVAFSLEGLSNQPLSTWTRMQKQQGHQTYTYDQIKSVSVEGADLKINQKSFVNCGTKKEAERHQRVIQELTQTQKNRRSEKILRYYQQRFCSVETLSEHIRDIQKFSHSYRILSSLLFTYIFLIGPLSYYLNPEPKRLLYCLIPGVLFGWVLSSLFYKIHLKLYPKETYSRVQSVLKQLFCFPIAIGAGKDVSLNAFVQYDPLLIAKCTLTGPAFERFCKKVWLDLRYPIQSDSILTYARTLYRDTIADFLQKNGINPEGLEKPSKDWNASSICYCPRCHMEFETQRSHCTECPGVFTQSIHTENKL